MNENNTSNEEDQSEDQEPKTRRRILIGLENVAEEIGTAVDEAIGAASEGIRETMTRVRAKRENVVTARLDDESIAKLDELVEAGVTGSRSEAAAFLIVEGIKAKKSTFDRIQDKVEEIREKREELRRLLEDEEGTPSSSTTASEGDTPRNTENLA